MAGNGELKRLSVVKDQAHFLYSKAAEFYAAGKGFVPAPIHDVLAKAESLGAPVVSSLADNGEKALSVVDSRVGSITSGQPSLGRGLASGTLPRLFVPPRLRSRYLGCT
jgi:hypothetical protein